MPVQTPLYKRTHPAYNQLVSFRFFLCACIFFSSTLRVSAAVVVNELYPKTQNQQTQFIELYNSGENAVSLDRWRIEQQSGDRKNFQFNASYIIQAKQFLLLPGAQTGIVFPIDGDTVTLRNEKNEIIDTQGYEGILGFNTSMGRTKDGAGVWVICSTATPETRNNCPEPTPTSTPLPTKKPTPTLYIDDTLYISSASVIPTAVVWENITPTSSHESSQAGQKITQQQNSIQGIVMGAVLILLWGGVLTVILLRQSKKVNA